MNRHAKITIVIFGSGNPKPDTPPYRQAYDLGKMLAIEGCAIANGGYGGTMAAAARGAAENRPSPDACPITGVTCDAFGRNGPNRWIDKEIRTETLNQRLDALINLGDAYIVLPGATGTLLEIALVWELINKHFLPSRPIIFLSEYWKPVIDTVIQTGEADVGCLVFVESLDQVRQVLNEYFG